MDEVICVLSNGFSSWMFSCGVFIDLEKAFDTVNQQIFLNKLNYYGIQTNGCHPTCLIDIKKYFKRRIFKITTNYMWGPTGVQGLIIYNKLNWKFQSW